MAAADHHEMWVSEKQVRGMVVEEFRVPLALAGRRARPGSARPFRSRGACQPTSARGCHRPWSWRMALGARFARRTPASASATAASSSNLALGNHKELQLDGLSVSAHIPVATQVDDHEEGEDVGGWKCRQVLT